jgi:hypothetical protein
LSTGECLSTFIFPVAINGLTVDTNETWFYALGSNGHVYSFQFERPSSNSVDYANDTVLHSHVIHEAATEALQTARYPGYPILSSISKVLVQT